MENKYLTTNEAVDVLKSGKKLKGYNDTDYCYYDFDNFSNPFRHVRSDGLNMEMESIWEHNCDKWEIFEEPVYEWQYFFYDNTIKAYNTTKFYTNEEFTLKEQSDHTYYQKIEQSKRERK